MQLEFVEKNGNALHISQHFIWNTNDGRCICNSHKRPIAKMQA